MKLKRSKFKTNLSKLYSPKKIPKDLKPSKKKNYRCPVCNFKNKKENLLFKSIYKDTSFPNYEHVRCSNCKSIYISNILSNQKLEFLHDKYYAKWENFDFNYFSDIKRSEIDRRNEWINFYKNKLPKFILNKKNKNSLDIGCGYGGCVSAFKRLKFDAFGIDVQKRCINKAKKNFPNAKFILGTIDNLIKNKYVNFDIITLHDVLEHIADPDGLIKKCKKILSNKGKIFIKVPNSQSLQINMLKEYSWEISAPFHRTLFSMQGLKKLSSKYKLKVEKSFDDINTWGWTRGLSIKNKIEQNYEFLRKNKYFVKLDYNIDLLFENISKRVDQKSILFIVLKNK